MAIRKTTITVNDDILAQAGEILGTSGITATIDEALHRVLVAEARQQVIEQLRTMDGLDLDNPEIMAGAWAE